ncbi:MAG: hypothetical protein ABF449_08190 [Ethanoligenens sp.]
MKRMKNNFRLFCILACAFLFYSLLAAATPVFAATASSSAGCQTMTDSGCAGGTACQAACGSSASCATSGTTGTTVTNTKYATAGTTQPSNKSNGAIIGLAVAAGVIAAAVIGFLILNRKPNRR